jgi:hypothetical protein
MIKKVVWLSLLAFSSVYAADIYVDYNKGNAKNPGTKDAPLRYIHQAAKKARPGDTVYVLPSPAPIRDNFKIANIHGTPDKPIIFDGMNNIFLGSTPLKESEWKEIKPGYYSKKVVTGKNWSHRFYMIFNGKINRMGRIQKSPGAAPYKKVDALAPGEWTVLFGAAVPSKNPHKQFETEYVVRLPQGAMRTREQHVRAQIDIGCIPEGFDCRLGIAGYKLKARFERLCKPDVSRCAGIAPYAAAQPHGLMRQLHSPLSVYEV